MINHRQFRRCSVNFAVMCACTVLVVPAVVNGETVTFEVRGTVTSIYAGPNPLIDPITPNVPESDPAFAQQFSANQEVVIRYSYDSLATDWYDQNVIESPNIGIYDAILAGTVTIDGLRYVLDSGNVSIQLDNSLGEDQHGINAYGYAVIADPIAASGVNLTYVVARDELYETDDLIVVPPGSWTRSFGRIAFLTDAPELLYEVRYSVTSISLVPEPTTALLIAVAGIVGISNYRRGVNGA